MKKTYIEPTIEIVKIAQTPTLLAGSVALNAEDATGAALSNEFDDLGMFDEESLIFGF